MCINILGSSHYRIIRNLVYVVYNSGGYKTCSEHCIAHSLLRLTDLDEIRLTMAVIPATDSNSITLFEHFDFKGNSFKITESSPDINPILPSEDQHGLSSFIVEKGTWKMYLEVNFAGSAIEMDGKTEFGPGKYNFRMVRKLNDKPQSVKLLPRVTLYTNWHFSEGDKDLADSSPDISADFPKGRKGMSSFIVHAGKWSLYTGSNYTGELVDIHGMTEFGPGKYELRGNAPSTMTQSL